MTDVVDLSKRSILKDIYDLLQSQQDQLDGLALRIKENNELVIKLMALIDLQQTFKQQQEHETIIKPSPKKIINTSRRVLIKAPSK